MLKLHLRVRFCLFLLAIFAHPQRATTINVAKMMIAPLSLSRVAILDATARRTRSAPAPWTNLQTSNSHFVHFPMTQSIALGAPLRLASVPTVRATFGHVTPQTQTLGAIRRNRSEPKNKRRQRCQSRTANTPLTQSPSAPRELPQGRPPACRGQADAPK